MLCKPETGARGRCRRPPDEDESEYDSKHRLEAATSTGGTAQARSAAAGRRSLLTLASNGTRVTLSVPPRLWSRPTLSVLPVVYGLLPVGYCFERTKYIGGHV